MVVSEESNNLSDYYIDCYWFGFSSLHSWFINNSVHKLL